MYYAYNKNVGGRGGWRLPTVEELRSLIDLRRAIPALPSGHPFIKCAVGFTGRLLPMLSIPVTHGDVNFRLYGVRGLRR